MKKAEQQEINNEIIAALEEFNANTAPITNVRQLRSCSAKVYKQGKYWVLQSYRTVVAFIDTDTDTLYDVLRWVYGYTSTSAQHIAKFRHDYGAGKWGCTRELRYYYA